VPDDIAKWLCRGIDAFEGGYCRSLCVALGLRGPGIKSKKRREQIKRRDMLLKWAADTCRSYPGEPLWSRCKTLADLIQRYPRSKSEHPLLEHIFDIGIHVPTRTADIYKRVSLLLKMRTVKK